MKREKVRVLLAKMRAVSASMTLCWLSGALLLALGVPSGAVSPLARACSSPRVLESSPLTSSRALESSPTSSSRALEASPTASLTALESSSLSSPSTLSSSESSAGAASRAVWWVVSLNSSKA
eukprot:Amastigsp_a339284_112.p6 type:complete len:123 gc:universal Amastigsp_a339284_112:144-512(+)